MNATLVTAGICLAGAAFAGCSTTTALARSERFVQRGNYYQAYMILRAAHGGDLRRVEEPRVRAIYLGYLLERGQEQVFNNEDGAAIRTFDQVLELDPGNAIATAWKEKTRRKLAAQATSRGHKALRSEELRGALEAFHDALAIVPGYTDALAGVEAVAKAVREREARADAKYYQGVMALGDQLYGMAWHHMVNALRLDPTHEPAKEIRDRAADRLASDRFARALRLEEASHFGAALLEYEAIYERWPDYPGLEYRMVGVRREVEVDRLQNEAEMAAFKGDYERARDLLRQAQKMTGRQQADVAELQLFTEERALTDLYRDARILELEGRPEEALTVYRQINRRWPSGFRDVPELVAGLEAATAAAAEAMARGEEAEARGDVQAAIAAYREALVLCPGYRQLAQRIEELESKRTET